MSNIRTSHLRVALALAALAAGGQAFAQGRPSTLDMTCEQARGLVYDRGAIVLSTGGHTYDRFVVDDRFCLTAEMTERRFAPTADAEACLVGDICVGRPRIKDRF